MGFKQGIDPLDRGAQKSDLRADAVVKVLLIRIEADRRRHCYSIDSRR